MNNFHDVFLLRGRYDACVRLLPLSCLLPLSWLLPLSFVAVDVIAVGALLGMLVVIDLLFVIVVSVHDEYGGVLGPVEGKMK